MGSCPEVKTNRPVRMACENGPNAEYALSVTIRVLSLMGKPPFSGGDWADARLPERSRHSGIP
jgi:hypothetical protein